MDNEIESGSKRKVKPAIVLSGGTMGLGVIRGLGVMGVPIVVVQYDKHDTGQVSKYVRERIQAPHPGEFEDQFVDLLIECAPRFEGGFLIPASDATLSVVSHHKRILDPYYILACTEWEITKQFIDKKHTYALADAIGVPAPKTLVPRSAEDVERYGRTIEYPCLVKPCQSHLFNAYFKEKMVQVEDLGQMLSIYQQAVDTGFEVMLQEIIPGDDANGVNYNSYFWDGQPLVEFTAEKVRNGPPWFGSPRVAISKEIPEIIEPGRKILQAMGFYGFSCTEFKKDAHDGVYKLMEVNGRHNLSSLLAVRCGINFPWLHYKHLVHGELPSAGGYRTGVYWIDIARDVGYSVKYRDRERYSLIQFIRPYLKPHVFAIFDLRDPKPFVHRCVDFIKRAFEAMPFAGNDTGFSQP